MKAPIYYASGSNSPGNIRGFAAIGHAIGVAADQLSPNAERELVSLRGRRVPVFVDSGAFSEVVFTERGVEVVKPISDAGWRERLDLYARLAKALGGQLSVVAPDRIGDQEETLRRLAKFAPELRAIRSLGARVLVPIQKGTRTQALFVRDVERALGFKDFVHAIPSKKKATTLAELRAYLTAVRPRRIHFLGLGIRNASAPAALAMIEKLCPGAEVSLDSNLITASVGRGPCPRILTRAQDVARGMIARGETTIKHAGELGIILAWKPGLATKYMTMFQRRSAEQARDVRMS